MVGETGQCLMVLGCLVVLDFLVLLGYLLMLDAMVLGLMVLCLLSLVVLRCRWNGGSAPAFLAIREGDHRDGPNIRLLREEVAQEVAEFPLAQGDDSFFLLDGVALLLRDAGQLLLQGDHVLLLIDEQPLAGDLMGNCPNGRRRNELRSLQRHGDAAGVSGNAETVGAQVVADGILHRVLQDDGGVRLDAQRRPLDVLNMDILSVDSCRQESGLTGDGLLGDLQIPNPRKLAYQHISREALCRPCSCGKIA